jgi:hypothetical protein
MADWFYKATNSKLDKVGTLLLARRGFLCRSAYSRKKAWVANVRRVLFDDVIHFYFIARKPAPIGAFRVVDLERFAPTGPAPLNTDFGNAVPGSALYEVRHPKFIADLDPDGEYSPDPKLGAFTGWLIERVGPATAAPPSFLKDRATLQAADDLTT